MTLPNRPHVSGDSDRDDEGGSPELLERIRAEIRDQGTISFAQFMEHALYAPGLGYYDRGSSVIGPTGDFVTASDVGRHFGRCLARQIDEIDRLTGPHDPFTVVEFGAGRGLLARDLIDHLAEAFPELRGRVTYRMIDRSRAMRQAAKARVPEAEVAEDPGKKAAAAGCVVAVELFDALPVRRVRRRDGNLVEVRVGLDPDDTLVEVESPAASELLSLADRLGAAVEEGTEAEVAPTLPDELSRLAACIERGVLLIVDYGDPAKQLYKRRRGTLLAYHRQATSESYLVRVGEQDLTAHVNFSALEDAARAIGLDVLGRTTQDRFLVANGILDIFEETDPERWRAAAQVKQRLQAMQLIHPSAMGRCFRVLMLAKNLAPLPELRGLDDPFGHTPLPSS